MMKRVITLALAFGATPSIALAHAVFADGQATAGSSFKAALGIPHGCDDLATQEVRLQIPEGFIGAKPMPKAGWMLEVIEGDFAESYSLHGQEVSRGPVEIRWTGGVLENAWYDEFVVRGTFDASLAGRTIAFPATQLCAGGGSVAWDEIAADGVDPDSLAYPAPTVRVAEDAGHEHHHGSAASPASTIEVADGFARAMLPGAPTGGGYLTLSNSGGEDDRLVGASSPRAGVVELHDMTMEGEMMRMRPMPEGVAIPAGSAVALNPGGLHLMFMDVAEPFAEGEEVPVTLEFEKAGRVDTILRVGPPNAASASSDAAPAGPGSHHAH